MGLHDRTKQLMYIPSGGNPEEMNEVSLQQPGMLGGRLIHPSTAGNKEYQLVQVDSTVAATPYAGAIAHWTDEANYKVGVTVTNRGRRAGVFTYAASPGRYTFIQKKGRHAAVKLVDAPTAEPTANRQFVVPSATAGKADVLAAGTAATYPVIGLTAGVRDVLNSTCAVDLDIDDIE